VSFLDVGQGDAIFIKSPTGVHVLIDGGPDRSVLRALSDVMPWHDRTIDVVVGTHPDQDHVGGLSYVLERYHVRHIFYAGFQRETAASIAFETARKDEPSAQSHTSRRGTIIDLGGGAFIRFLFPDRPVEGVETNTASAIMELVYGDIEFLFTGDSPEAIEKYVVTLDGEKLQSEVLKLGHHGSNTSNSEIFLKTVNPDYVVISASKDNSYGHPHKEVMDRLKNLGIEWLGTYDEGTITFETDGHNLVLEH
jgi:competence protein ComEC